MSLFKGQRVNYSWQRKKIIIFSICLEHVGIYYVSQWTSLVIHKNVILWDLQVLKKYTLTSSGRRQSSDVGVMRNTYEKNMKLYLYKNEIYEIK